MAPQAEPITTVDEIDEALWWVVLSCSRDAHYGRIVDALLDQRNRVSQGHPYSLGPRQSRPGPQGQGAPPAGSSRPSRDCPDSASSK